MLDLPSNTAVALAIGLAGGALAGRILSAFL